MTYDHWKTTEPDYGTRGTEREEEYRDEIDRLVALCAAQKDEIDSLHASHAALLAAAKDAETLIKNLIDVWRS